MINEIFERALIIGGTGFVGSNLVSELLRSGFSPTVLTRNKERHKLPENLKKKTSLVELDITDYSSTKSFILDFRPTLIINSAATLGLEDINGKTVYDINYEAVKNLLETSLAAKVKKIILFGSADEYGYQPIPQNENLPLRPNSPYAVSKARMTNLARQMYENERLPVVILRPFTVYGKEQPKGMFLSDAIRCALGNRSFEMSEGKQKRDYIFISDFVRAIMSAIRTPDIDGEVFNVGSGQALPLREIARKVWEVSGADGSLLKIGARSASLSELHDTCADITKAEKFLNWQPNISLEDGLNQTINSIKENSKT
ncbi:MAG TPA: NAD(P)-dependent oxidoreductase [Pyrinomonadaceae bacterium]|nr:NAD(P)-dependent oxidoreductase [Pyrinomonadaceae bacterium]